MRTQVRRTAPLGELVATVFDKAELYSADPREVVRLATGALRRIFRRHDSGVFADPMHPGGRPIAISPRD